MVGLELAKFYSELGQVSNAFFIILINILLVNTRNTTKKCSFFYISIIAGNFREKGNILNQKLFSPFFKAGFFHKSYNNHDLTKKSVEKKLR